MPVATLNVEPETPLSLHGETAEKPIPAPNATSKSVSAAAATAPAATAPHDTAGWASTIVVAPRRSVSMECSRGNNQWFVIPSHQESSIDTAECLGAPRCNRLVKTEIAYGWRKRS